MPAIGKRGRVGSSNQSSKRQKSNNTQAIKPSKQAVANFTTEDTSNESNDQSNDETLDLAWLLAPLSVADFKEKYFDVQPLHISRSKQASKYNDLFSLEKLREIVAECEKRSADEQPDEDEESTEQSDDPYRPLLFGSDFNLAKTLKGKRKNMNPDSRIVSLKSIDQSFGVGSTIQFIQPQRFASKVRSLIRSLETEFGSLVGANAYLTPGLSQGLAVHFDDIDVFALQCEGSKEWSIFEPVEPLARQHSRDFASGELKLAQTIVLLPGDLLYLPRGTPHCARTVNPSNNQSQHSTHLTISAHQKMTLVDVVRTSVNRAVQQCWDTNVDVRACLPWQIGMAVTQSIGQPSESNEPSELEKLRVMHDELIDAIPKLAKQQFIRAIEEIGEEFTLNRLPPIKESADQSINQTIKSTDRVRLTDPTVTLLQVRNEEIENGELADPLVEIVHPFLNKISTHMVNTSLNGPVLPVERARIQLPVQAVATCLQLFHAGKQWTPVKSISKEYRYVLEALHENGVLQVDNGDNAE